MVPEPIERDEELGLPSTEDVAAEAADGSVGEAMQAGEAGMEELAAIAPEEFMDPQPQLQAEERGAGAGAQAQGSKLLHQDSGRGRGRGRAGVSEPIEVSQDTAEPTDEEMEDGEMLRASA
eukprot:1161370-Pelagomonas_calceolata.AAC.1